MKEKAILVGCQLPHVSDERFSYSMEELAALTKTADGTVVSTVTQKRNRVDAATYIGKGKVDELAVLCEELSPDVLIFNDELSPSQLKALVTTLDVKIIDRTQLILDIFAKRARTREGKLQIELAQLQYALPRLSGQESTCQGKAAESEQEVPERQSWKPTGAISETGFMKSMFSCLPSFATEADTEKEERKTAYCKSRSSATPMQGNRHGLTGLQTPTAMKKTCCLPHLTQ